MEGVSNILLFIPYCVIWMFCMIGGFTYINIKRPKKLKPKI